MRTTVDLPPSVHRRAQRLAAEQHRSLSAVVAELTLRGLAQLDAPVDLTLDEQTGLPVLAIGRTISADEVDEILDDE